MDSRTKRPFQARVSNFLVASDWRLSRAIHWCFTTVCFVGLLALGSLSLALCYLSIFEYQDAWFDLSLAEWLFFALAIALITRLVFIARRSAAPWWHAPIAFLRVLGSFLVIESLLITMAVVVDFINQDDTALQSYIVLDDLYGDKVLLVLILVSLYIATPPFPRTPPLLVDEVLSEESSESERMVEADDIKDRSGPEDPWTKDTPYSSSN
ncbi:MAG: hypothetical protein GYB21_07455 [Oceanospirillales bacterium]|nr:hypothetical protein [Oceanospirillales bacterium]